MKYIIIGIVIILILYCVYSEKLDNYNPNCNNPMGCFVCPVGWIRMGETCVNPMNPHIPPVPCPHGYHRVDGICKPQN